MTKTTSPSILHVSTHADLGGAARASNRIAQCQYQHGLDSQLLSMTSIATSAVVKKFEPVSITDKLHTAHKFLRRSRASSYKDSPLLIGEDSEISDSVTGFLSHINDSSREIVNLHWINGLLSIKEIGSINKPVVWTLHDMWAFCGREHYSSRSYWKLGNEVHAPSTTGTDHYLDEAFMNKKIESWRRPMTIVAPSHWLARCASESKLMNQWPICVIPNPIDTDRWHPVCPKFAKAKLGLPESQTVIAFGGFGCMTDPNKGFDLLLSAINRMARLAKRPLLVVFGEKQTDQVPKFDCPVYYLGTIEDDTKLQLLYSAADVLAVPSRQDAFNQIAAEAQSCGTPVVAFNNTGPADIVEHGTTGYLAKAFDTDDFAKGLHWLLDMLEPQRAKHRHQARTRAISLFSYSIIASRYLDLYMRVREQSRHQTKSSF
jgi:glycosyltransferase involved in cell wall biosynthesis